ncbi:GntR family transcriptional regulator [Paenibacillus protaetiae]|uniref:GntR family transcriptional regulator n=1 Tax=Paenibacillus protaetiae TaxID=2509456 RepID=A0A4P6EWE9_9BACL|nr:GntR family transcriptional regulator [Paenibacillus protaetiae]QAY67036.1 GntR family transcriptional regulator [Paenibacillus protaetiae]
MDQPTKRVPHYVQIRKYVNDQIQQLKWREGDRLPSENELAAQFGVSRITVKNALDSLVQEGIIYRIQGKGSFVSVSGGEPALYRKEEPASHPLVAYITPVLNNSFTALLLSGIEEELSQHGHKVVFSKSDGCLIKEKQLIQEALELGVRGILIFPADGEKYNEEIVQLSMSDFPIVLIDRDLPGLSMHCVCSDHEGGAYAATKHLIELGHTSVAYLSASPPFTSSMEERLAGYEKALVDSGMPIFHHHRAKVVSPQDIVDFLEANPDITAVFAENSGVGQAVLEAAKQLGLSVPERLSVAFFDDIEFPNLHVTTPTVVVQQERLIGKESAKLLLKVMDDPRQPKQKVLLPTELLKRQSTAAPLHSVKS